MSQYRMLDAYVRSLLQEISGIEDPGPFGGPYQIQFNLDDEHSLFVRISVPEEGAPHVVARSPAVADVTPGPDLYKMLNGLNATHGPPHAVVVENAVWVQGSRPGDGLDTEDLDALIDDVCLMATHLARTLPDSIGGRPNVVPPDPSSVAAASRPEEHGRVGAYL